MGKRECRRWLFSLEQGNDLVLLSALFLLGGLSGCFFSELAAMSGSEHLASYLVDYLVLADDGTVKHSLWRSLWSELRYVLFIVLFGMTPVKRVGIPVVLFLRGFFLSFSLCCFLQVFGSIGLLLGILTFLMPALLWGPALFVAGFQAITVGSSLWEERFWLRAGICGILLLACVGFECGVVPILLRVAARVVL